VWEEFGKHCCDISKTWIGKENDVDLMMGIDAIDACSEARCTSEFNTLTLVSGGKDFAPLLEKLSSDRFKHIQTVEIWSWEHCLTEHLRDMPSTEGKCKIRKLNNFIDKIGCLELEWSLPAHEIPRHQTIVIVNFQPECRDFLDKIPFPYFLYDLREMGAFAIILTSVSIDELNSILAEAQLQMDTTAAKVLSYVSWLQQHKLRVPELLPCNGEAKSVPMLSYEDSDQEDGSTVNDNSAYSAVNENSEYQVVQRRKKKKAQVKSTGKLCRFGKYCKHYLRNKCPSGHSKEVEQYFAATGRPKRIIKQIPCSLEHCIRGRSCDYLHPGELKLCLICDSQHDCSCKIHDDVEFQLEVDRICEDGGGTGKVVENSDTAADLDGKQLLLDGDMPDDNTLAVPCAESKHELRAYVYSNQVHVHLDWDQDFVHNPDFDCTFKLNDVACNDLLREANFDDFDSTSNLLYRACSDLLEEYNNFADLNSTSKLPGAGFDDIDFLLDGDQPDDNIMAVQCAESRHELQRAYVYSNQSHVHVECDQDFVHNPDFDSTFKLNDMACNDSLRESNFADFDSTNILYWACSDLLEEPNNFADFDSTSKLHWANLLREPNLADSPNLTDFEQPDWACNFLQKPNGLADFDATHKPHNQAAQKPGL